MRVTSEPLNTPHPSVDVLAVLNSGNVSSVVLAQLRQERLSTPRPNSPKEDQLNLPKGTIDFVLSNMLGSVAGQYGLASINPSIRFGIGAQLLNEAQRDRSPRGALMRRLGQCMIDSAAAEFKATHTRPNTELVAMAQHAAQNQGEQLIMNVTADVTSGQLAKLALGALQHFLKPLGAKAKAYLEKSRQWFEKLKVVFEGPASLPDARRVGNLPPNGGGGGVKTNADQTKPVPQLPPAQEVTVRSDGFDGPSSLRGATTEVWAEKVIESSSRMIAEGASPNQVREFIRRSRGQLAENSARNNPMDYSSGYFGLGRDPLDVYSTPFVGRYASYAGRARDLIKDRGLKSFGAMIDGKPVELTTINVDVSGRLLMTHTPGKNVDVLLKEIDRLSDLLVIKKPDLTKTQIIDRLADIYWLQWHAMPYARGSALITDVFGRSLARAVGINLPSWRKNVLPDLEALTMDKLQFRSKFRDLFSTPP